MFSIFFFFFLLSRYLTLFISEALQKIGNCDLESAKKEMYTLSIQEFWTPASPTWPLAGFVVFVLCLVVFDIFADSFTSKPASRAEQDQVRAWLAQLRQECGVRLCEQVFAADPKKASKFWMAFKVGGRTENSGIEFCGFFVFSLFCSPQSKKFLNKTLYDEGKK